MVRKKKSTVRKGNARRDDVNRISMRATNVNLNADKAGYHSSSIRMTSR